MLGRDTGYGDAELLPRLSDCFRWREWDIREPEHLITRDSIYASLFLSLYFSLVAIFYVAATRTRRPEDASPGESFVGSRGQAPPPLLCASPSVRRERAHGPLHERTEKSVRRTCCGRIEPVPLAHCP